MGGVGFLAELTAVLVHTLNTVAVTPASWFVADYSWQLSNSSVTLKTSVNFWINDCFHGESFTFFLRIFQNQTLFYKILNPTE